ncbi:hypothetical protein O9G_004231 [Rozella allomycis CSF55]|uniref:Uncharacterized protein n=1 Tax=Rozella allomycis (strain CSF55) TaxID=988480 RepID=A0A075B103_ROZAC|nr:hypothetical protein O9G_004231 [Rozella allomycis CSF55]|eukprot:EPZ36249.1 hypothetical protein O9G_004231 [Rozella allomycis CSF55]
MKSTKEIKEKALQINMKVLKRYDDEAAEIIDMSSHVVLYQFDEDASTWILKALYLFIDELNITNFKGTFSSQIDLQLTDAYIIFRSQNGMFSMLATEIKPQTPTKSIFSGDVAKGPPIFSQKSPQLARANHSNVMTTPKGVNCASNDLEELFRRAALRNEKARSVITPGRDLKTVEPISDLPLNNRGIVSATRNPPSALESSETDSDVSDNSITDVSQTKRRITRRKGNRPIAKLLQSTSLPVEHLIKHSESSATLTKEEFKKRIIDLINVITQLRINIVRSDCCK